MRSAVRGVCAYRLGYNIGNWMIFYTQNLDDIFCNIDTPS